MRPKAEDPIVRAANNDIENEMRRRRGEVADDRTGAPLTSREDMMAPLQRMAAEQMRRSARTKGGDR